MKNPLVSVVVPNYNHASFLEERIDSILNQTYGNFEIIILDDNSTDNSREIIERYRHNEKVVNIVFNEINSGNTFLQWRKGLELSKGELVWIAESDDFCDSRMLEVLVDALTRSNDIVLAYTTSTLVDENGSIIYKRDKFSTKIVNSAYYLGHYLSQYNYVQNASSAIFRRDVALAIDKQYMQFLGAGDYMFWVEIAMRGSVAIVNQGLNYFRRHTGVVTSKREMDGTNFLEEKRIFDYINNNIYLSWLRKRYAYAYRMNIIKDIQFKDIETKNRIFELWELEKHNTPFDRLLLRIANRLRNYNYYL